MKDDYTAGYEQAVQDLGKANTKDLLIAMLESQLKVKIQAYEILRFYTDDLLTKVNIIERLELERQLNELKK